MFLTEWTWGEMNGLVGGDVELWKSVEMNWWRSGIVWKFVEMLFLRWQPVHSLLFSGCQHGFTFLTRVKKCSKILRKTLSFVKLVKYFKLGNLDVDFGFQRISFPENTDVGCVVQSDSSNHSLSQSLPNISFDQESLSPSSCQTTTLNYHPDDHTWLSSLHSPFLLFANCVEFSKYAHVKSFRRS